MEFIIKTTPRIVKKVLGSERTEHMKFKTLFKCVFSTRLKVLPFLKVVFDKYYLTFCKYSTLTQVQNLLAIGDIF